MVLGAVFGPCSVCSLLSRCGIIAPPDFGRLEHGKFLSSAALALSCDTKDALLQAIPAKEEGQQQTWAAASSFRIDSVSAAA